METSILSTLKNHLNSKSDYDSYIQPLSFSNNLIDSVEKEFPNDDQDILKNDYLESKEKYMTYALGHISTNPFRKEQEHLLNRLFLHDDENDINPPLEETPNYNPKSKIHFLNALTKGCDEIRQLQAINRRISPMVYYLKSDRGVGKTFFINHFFTIYNSALWDSRIIWVRIDLDNPIITKKTNIQKYLGCKLLKIILRYYCRNPKTDFGFFVKDVKETINRTVDEERYREMAFSSFSYYVHLFLTRNKDEEVTDDLFDPYVISCMYDVLQRRNIKIIYIIDNIDLIDKSQKRREKLASVINQLKNTLLQNLREEGIFIITFRNNLQNYISKTITASNSSIICRNFNLLYIDFDRIINKKLDVIDLRVKELGRSNNWNLDAWSNHFNNFRSFVSDISGTKNYEGYLDLLETAYLQNNRSKTQITQLLHYFFLFLENSKSKYRLIEYLLLCGRRFPQKVFYYKSINDKLFLHSTERTYDNIFVPNLFVYPYSKDSEFLCNPYSKTYLLVKIRLIQILYYLSELSFTVTQELRVSKITNYLKVLFNYDKQVVLLCIDEFCELEFLSLVKDNGDFISTESSFVGINKKFYTYFNNLFYTSKEHQEIKRELINSEMIRNIAYFSMCALRVPINVEDCKNLIFFPVPYYKQKSELLRIQEWIACKIINSITLLKYIKTIDLFEKKFSNHDEQIDRVGNEILAWIKGQNFCELLISECLGQVESIIGTLDSESFNMVSRRITSHFSKL